MDISNKEDKQNFKIGLLVTILIAISLLLFTLFWKREPHQGLSCLGVQNKINDLITTAERYREYGTTYPNKEILAEKLEVALEENERLNCKFSEKAIRMKFNP
jgi:hypothetical protein